MTDTQSNKRFIPEDEMQRTKSVFWSRMRSNNQTARVPDGQSPESVSLAEAVRITGDLRLQDWWSDDFASWFSNDGSFDEEMQYLIDMFPAHVERILTADAPQLGAKVTALKLIAEVAGLRKSDDGSAKDKFTKMSEDQLRAFVRKHMAKRGLEVVGGEKD